MLRDLRLHRNRPHPVPRQVIVRQPEQLIHILDGDLPHIILYRAAEAHAELGHPIG